MGGLAESNAGYSFGSASTTGFSNAGTPTSPPAITSDANRCPHSKYECAQVAAKVKIAEDTIERERNNMREEKQRLLDLEAVLSRGETGGQYSLNMQRIKRMQDIDIIQRNNVMLAEEEAAVARKALADVRNGKAESDAERKVAAVAGALRQIPHAPICKVDAGQTCTCYMKQIKTIMES